jgi:hypothetical protein
VIHHRITEDTGGIYGDRRSGENSNRIDRMNRIKKKN